MYRPLSRRIVSDIGPLGLAVALCINGVARADLASYVKTPDRSYAWTVEQEMQAPGLGSVVVTRLVSQTWKGIDWKHWLSVIRPEHVTHPGHAMLVISGGSSRSRAPRAISGETRRLARIALSTGSVVAVLGQVPNQPLFGSLYEDGLIAYTFQKCLETKDTTWPCLLPMTKSAVRGMDAVQAIVAKKFSQKIEKFTVTGASKRGWTTWLTGAVDPRVVAIAPMVIDTLNFPEQMKLQVKSFGGYSEQIHDYSDRGLPDMLANDPRTRPLVDLVDPYAYRARLTMPKLIVLGTNDRYWPVDAVKVYFDDLKGEKYIHYVPNEGHGLGAGALEAITAFHHTVINGQRRPRFTWKLDPRPRDVRLTMQTQDAPKRAVLWHATAPTRDFRDARWTSTPMVKQKTGVYEGTRPRPGKGFAALFGRLTYASGAGGDYGLCSNVEVIEAKGPRKN